MEAIRRLAMSAGLSGLLVLGFAAPSLAANQEGLVNVNVQDVTVQLPIAIAANVCDTAVNVLARDFRAGDTECESDATSGAVFPMPGNGGGNTNQQGLINVNVQGVLIQVPIAVAANICDTTVNLLAIDARLGDTTCTAVADSSAE